MAHGIGMVALLTALVLGCATSQGQGRSAIRSEDALREAMVKQIASQGIADALVLKPVEEVPCHLFVPPPSVPG